jgi:hypothetical protein
LTSGLHFQNHKRDASDYHLEANSLMFSTSVLQQYSNCQIFGIHSNSNGGQQWPRSGTSLIQLSSATLRDVSAATRFLSTDLPTQASLLLTKNHFRHSLPQSRPYLVIVSFIPSPLWGLIRSTSSSLISPSPSMSSTFPTHHAHRQYDRRR